MAIKMAAKTVNELSQRKDIMFIRFVRTREFAPVGACAA
jgi:hypothetical protein